jgi:hypothetical protein
LSYADAARLAMQRLKKKPVHVGKSAVRIERLQVLPSGNDLIVAAHFCVPLGWDFTHLLDSCGDGYLRGTPGFDAKSNSIRIENLHYDIGTENLMLRVMRTLAGHEFSNALQRQLVFDESREIGKLKAEIAAALAKPQGRGIALTGKVTSFGEPRLSWTNGGFLALFTANGILSTNLDLKNLH